jgi:hypothetical protein
VNNLPKKLSKKLTARESASHQGTASAVPQLRSRVSRLQALPA